MSDSPIESTESLSPFTLEQAPEAGRDEPLGAGFDELSAEAPEEASPSSPPHGEASPPPSGAPPRETADVLALREELRRVEREQHELMGAVRPLMSRLAGEAAQDKPGPTIDDFRDPNSQLGVNDFVAFLQNQWRQDQAAVSAQQEYIARRVTSEQSARGLLSADAMGAPDRAYDAVVQKYVRPIYEKYPHLADAIHQLYPDSPAELDYDLGLVLKVFERHRDDPVTSRRALWDYLDGKTDGETARRIAETARRSADRVTGSAVGRITGEDLGGDYRPGQFKSMSDDEFEKAQREIQGY